MALLDPTLLYYILPRLYSSLHDSSVALLHSTLALLDSTLLYYILSWLYLSLLDSLKWICMTTLLHSTIIMTLLYSTALYHMALLNSTTLYHGSS